MMHSFWYGEQIERFEGLSFYQVTEEILSQLLPRESRSLNCSGTRRWMSRILCI